MTRLGKEVVSSALRRACAAHVGTGTVSHRPDVELCLGDVCQGSVWRLVWREGRAQVLCEDSSSQSGNVVRVCTTMETLSKLASGELSALSALRRGLVKVERGGFEREQVVWCFPILKQAGLELVRRRIDERELLYDLEVWITGERLVEEAGGYAYCAYRICVASSGEQWNVERRYSQFRQLWRQVDKEVHIDDRDSVSSMRSPLSMSRLALCVNDEKGDASGARFPSRRGPLASRLKRRAELEAWLQRTARRTQVDVAEHLYPFLEVPRELCELLACDRHTSKSLRAPICGDAAGANRARALRRARELEKYVQKLLFADTKLFLRTFLAWTLCVAMSVLFPKIVAPLVCIFAPPLAALPVFVVTVKGQAWTMAAAISMRVVAGEIGLVRAAHVYAVASCAISVYVVATAAVDRVWKLEKGTEHREAYFDSIHRLVAPLVADQMAALKSIWVKIGQYVSVRADVVPKPWNEALKVLQDDLPADNKRQICRTLREAYGIGRVFDSFDYTPLASASIAQVHTAYYEGRKVAVKIQHRGVAELFRADIRRAIKIARFCAKLNSDFEATVTILETWQRDLWKELDFTLEAANARRARALLSEVAGADDVVVPAPIDALVAQTAFAMDFFEPSFKIDDDDLLSEAYYAVDKTALCTKLAHVLSYLLFDRGFTNADPHPGNVLVGPSPTDPTDFRIALLDWGWSLELQRNELNAWRDLVIALKDLDVQAASQALRSLGYKNSQDDRVPERSVQFFAFLLRDTSGRHDAQAQTKQFFDKRKAQEKADTAKKVREAKGRRVQALPESFLCVVRTLGAFRGICAHLGVELPLSEIMAHHAKTGQMRDATAASSTNDSQRQSNDQDATALHRRPAPPPVDVVGNRM